MPVVEGNAIGASAGSPDYSWPRSSGYTLSYTNPKRKRGQVAVRPSLALRVSMGP